MAGARKRVVIVGGGAGGLILANSLAIRGEYDVTLLNDTPYHYYWPQLLQIAFRGDESQLRRPIDGLVRRGVNLIIDRAEAVNLNERKVVTTSGRELSYDFVVLAPGLTIDHSAIKGNDKLVELFGDFHSTPENAWKVYSTITSIRKGGFVVAVADPGHRCPPSPYEGVLLADEALRLRGVRNDVSITLAVPYPRPYPSETFNEVLEPILKERGIEVETFFTVDSVDLEGKKLIALEGGELQFDAAVIVPIHKGPRLKVIPEDLKNEDGFIKADKMMNRIGNFDDAYAIGDASTSANVRTGVTAHLQAKVVERRLRGEPAVNTGRTNCPTELGFGQGTFVISDYGHPPVKLPPNRVFYLLKRLFADTYWDVLKHPEFWDPLFDSYLEATDPGRLWQIFK
ncbi:MAG: NAD(P)/FAD-dependent oxidoreductase [Acidilobus sp.]